MPFERVPDVELNSNIVHMLNMPPEMDMDALVSKVGAMSGVVHHCYCFRPTEVKIIFVSMSMANEAKRMLDSIKIDRLFTLFDTKLFGQPLNTTLTLKLLVAHGKLRYRNPRLQNTLLNNINLQELDSSIDREVGFHRMQFCFYPNSLCHTLAVWLLI